ncbi:helix-turn-helix transcriptional regulator [Marinomonas algarum]|uniref:WYL domain-containing protein n=1 Tax=Marinomonas algarum TaxID=2883105 RepID=A0A9X1IP91_9GAMM|nr:WYL domain-containing protein [Marinomonas algarum]MCB5162632.1 WYL domain-containing protein [Marinomonas algarum]
MADSGMRQILILMELPRWPKYKTTKQLVDYLKNQGINVTARTVQRDIQMLSASGAFSIIDTPATGRGKEGVGWAFSEHSIHRGLPVMDPSAALTLLMGYEHLKCLMPEKVLKHIEQYIDEAKAILETFNQANFTSWFDKIRILPNTILMPAKIDQEAVGEIYEALLANKKFKCRYNGRPDQIVSPFGIVQRANTLYLIGKFFDYNDIRITALQRYSDVERLDESIKQDPNFNIDSYLDQGEMSWPWDREKSDTTVKLKANIHSYLKYHLTEMPLSTDQKIQNNKESESYKLTATVVDSHELRYWILSQGDKIEVLSPKSMRQWIAQIAGNMNTMYQHD